MIFEAVVYHTDTSLIFNLYAMNTVASDETISYRETPTFFIKTSAEFKLTHHGIYLPGYVDRLQPLPRSKCLNFKSMKLTEWLIAYKDVYEALNNCSPIIHNLNTNFETEDTPQMKLA